MSVNSKIHEYRLAANKFIEQEKLSSSTRGIFLTGSIVSGNLNKNSDVDVFIILNDKLNYRERGNLFIDGVEIEYFKNPIKQVRAYLKSEKSPHTAHMLVHGELVYKNSIIITQLIQLAEEIIKIGRPPLNEFQIEVVKYKIDDFFKDLEYCKDIDDQVGFEIIKLELLPLLVDTFFHINAKFTPKNKWMNNSLVQDHPEIHAYFSTYKKNQIEDFKAIKSLKNSIEESIGGKRSTPWVLRSDLKL